MRRWLPAVVAALLAVSGAVTVATAPAAIAAAKPAAHDSSPPVGHPGPKVHKVVRGTYQRIAADVANARVPAGVTIPPPLSNTHDVYRDVLEVGDSWLDLHLPRGHHLRPGQQVELDGVGNANSFDATTVKLLPHAIAAVDTTDVTKTLVILAYWGSGHDAMTKAKAADVVFTQGNAWWKETSYGLTSLSGTVVGWVQIPNPGDCYSNGDALMTSARNKAAGLIGSLAGFERTIVYFPFCAAAAGAAGWAYVPGTRVWINGYMDKRVTIHEQGHNYGLLHAHFYSCTSGGVHVSLGGSCTSSEYGDNYDAMGGASYVGEFSAAQKAKLGWLPSRVHTYSASGTATITPLETASGVKGGKIPGTGRTYWVEYRTAQGQDKGFPSGGLGVLVHLSDPDIYDGGNQLLDMRPTAGGADNVSLPLGSSWTTPEKIRITFKSANTSGAQVAVQFSAPPAGVPSAPGSVTAKAGDTAALVSWGASNDNGAALTGYKVHYQTGTTVKTVTVNSAGGSVRTAHVTGLTNSTTYTVWVTATNSVGESAPSAKVTVTPVIQVPSVILTAPSDGSTIFSDRVPISATPTVNPNSKQPIQNVQFFVDGEYDSGVPAAPYTTVWDATFAADGPHTVRAVTVDANNRVGNSSLVHFTLHKPVPSVTITGAQPDAVDPNLIHVSVHATAGSPTTQIQSVVLNYDDGQFAGAVDFPQSADPIIDWDVRWVAGGPHTLIATASDDADRSTTSSPFAFDVVHPTPTVVITAPAASSTQFGNFTVSTMPAAGHNANGTAGADVSTVEVIADSTVILGTVGAPSNPGDPWNVDVFGNQLTAGPHVLRARVTDLDGYVGLSDPVSVTFEPPVPTVTISSPVQNDTVFGHDSSGAIAVVTQPAPSVHGATPISYVEVLVDDVSLGFAGPDDPNNPAGTWTAQLSLTTVAAGPHVLVARATDQAGYAGTSPPIQINVLVPLPGVTLTAPGAGTFSGIFTATATPAPNATSGAPIQEVDFQLDGQTVVSDFDGTDGWSADIDPNSYDNGAHSLTAAAVDGFSYRGSSAATIVTFSTPGPTATITDPVPDSSTRIQPSLDVVNVSAEVGSTAADDLSSVSLLVDGSSVDSHLGPTAGTVQLSWGSPSAGSHTLRIEVSDVVGRTRHSSTKTLTLLTTPQPPSGYAEGGDGKITLHWYPPFDTGGAQVTSYTIRESDPDTDPNMQSPLLTKTLTAADLDLTATDFTYDLFNQPANVQRVLTVTAKTAPDVPESAPSDPSYASAYDATAPDPVVGLTAVGSMSGMTVSWSASPSADVDAQDVYVDDGVVALLYGTPKTLGSAARSTPLSGLTTADDQTVTVVTRDASGNVGPPASVTVRATRVSLTRSVATITYGATSTLTATVRQADNSAALPGVAVQFLGRPKGVGSYSLLGTRTASSGGVATLAVKPSRNMDYIARYSGGSLRFGSQTGAVTVLVRTRVTTTLSVTSLHLGKSVVIKGSVAPKHAGQKVLLQRLVAGTWKTIATVTLSSLSTYRFTWKPPKRATFSLRVFKPADADHVASAGPTRKLRVL